MTDFNLEGSDFAYEAHKKLPEHYQMASTRVCKFIEKLWIAIDRKHHEGTLSHLTLSTLGCLDRLSACVLQVARLYDHAETIRSQAPTESGNLICVRAVETLFDFEALLFHCRSALDRLAFFVARQVYGVDCDNYAKLAKVAGNFAQKDPRAESLIEILNGSAGVFQGVVIDTAEGKKSLRSHLIHKSTATENCSAAFTLHCISPGKRLSFDTVIADHALFGTAWDLASATQLVVLNTLSLYVGGDDQDHLIDAGLEKHHGLVDYRCYETTESNGIIFSIWEAQPSGFRLTPVRLRPEVCMLAY